MKILIIALMVVFLLGCISPLRQHQLMEEDPMNGKTISFQTMDGITLVGTYWENKDSLKPPVILVHQFNKDRHSFDLFAQKLYQNGFSVLSYDQRGFGDSTKKGNVTISFSSFSENDFQKMAVDINTAQAFLESPVLVVGASIGANSALNYGATNQPVKGLVLLSPGIDYKGINVQSAIQTNLVPFLVVASSEDSYAASSSQTIFSTSPISDKKMVIVESAGHGTDMFLKKPELVDEVVAWLEVHSH